MLIRNGRKIGHGGIDLGPSDPLPSDTEVWLREVDAGTPNACWVVCNKVDPGAVKFIPEKVW